MHWWQFHCIEPPAGRSECQRDAPIYPHWPWRMQIHWDGTKYLRGESIVFSEFAHKHNLTYANTVYVRRVAKESLLGCLFADIPQFSSSIHGPSHIGILIRRQWDGHNISGMGIKLWSLFAKLQVPLGTREEVFVLFRTSVNESTHIFISPDPVINFLSSKKRQELRKPSYPASSLTIFAAPVASRLFKSYTVHILSIPPQAKLKPIMSALCP